MGVYLASSSSKKALPKSPEKSSRVLFAESRTRTWQAKNVSQSIRRNCEAERGGDRDLCRR